MLNNLERKEAAPEARPTLEDSPLFQQAKDAGATKPLSEYDSPLTRGANPDVQEVNSPIKNKQDGLEREREVRGELEKKYPPEDGYEIISESYLRDENGKIVRDPETGEARRIDFVVVKDGKVVDSIEVTSKTADKTQQSAKEDRIRRAVGTMSEIAMETLLRFLLMLKPVSNEKINTPHK